jgi:hypothetical protein
VPESALGVPKGSYGLGTDDTQRSMHLYNSSRYLVDRSSQEIGVSDLVVQAPDRCQRLAMNIPVLTSQNQQSPKPPRLVPPHVHSSRVLEQGSTVQQCYHPLLLELASKRLILSLSVSGSFWSPANLARVLITRIYHPRPSETLCLCRTYATLTTSIYACSENAT